MISQFRSGLSFRPAWIGGLAVLCLVAFAHPASQGATATTSSYPERCWTTIDEVEVCESRLYLATAAPASDPPLVAVTRRAELSNHGDMRLDSVTPPAGDPFRFDHMVAETVGWPNGTARFEGSFDGPLETAVIDVIIQHSGVLGITDQGWIVITTRLFIDGELIYESPTSGRAAWPHDASLGGIGQAERARLPIAGLGIRDAGPHDIALEIDYAGEFLFGSEQFPSRIVLNAQCTSWELITADCTDPSLEP